MWVSMWYLKFFGFLLDIFVLYFLVFFFLKKKRFMEKKKNKREMRLRETGY